MTVFAAVTLTLIPAMGFAQNFPDRPFNLILAFPAGSATDSAVSYVADELLKS